jgi:hypothetical protein
MDQRIEAFLAETFSRLRAKRRGSPLSLAAEERPLVGLARLDAAPERAGG